MTEPIPLEREPVDDATRRARHDAHRAFDQLWESGAMTRRQAYRWLQVTLGLSDDEAHIARLDVAQCAELTAAAKRITYDAVTKATQQRRSA
jgi:hypothetical protein